MLVGESVYSLIRGQVHKLAATCVSTLCGAKPHDDAWRPRTGAAVADHGDRLQTMRDANMNKLSTQRSLFVFSSDIVIEHVV